MDEWTRERYGPITEVDLWAELHPGEQMPKRLRDAARARRNRERRAAELEAQLSEPRHGIAA